MNRENESVMASQVHAYIQNLKPSNTAQIMHVIDGAFMELPGVVSKLSFKVPFYYKHSWICYLNPMKPYGVELCFLRAREMSDEAKLLNFKDRKIVGGIAIKELDGIFMKTLLAYFHEALLIDEWVKNVKKKK
jgi:hypothetical protein